MTDMSESENHSIELQGHQCICTLASLVERWTELEDLKEQMAKEERIKNEMIK